MLCPTAADITEYQRAISEQVVNWEDSQKYQFHTPVWWEGVPMNNPLLEAVFVQMSPLRHPDFRVFYYILWTVTNNP